MADYKALIKELTRQLYPTGRAFKMPDDSYFESMIDGLIESENRFHKDARGVLSAILPDNDLFTEEDATRWEILLGMIVNESVDLEERKLAILRKINHPGTTRARQGLGYIQNSLQAAGFNVYLFENIPETLIYDFPPEQYDVVGFGEVGFGEVGFGELIYNNTNKIANHIDEAKDATFIPGSYRSAFFIGGITLGSYADVPEIRKDEFRQLVLKLKPVQSVAYLYINYV